MLALSAWWSLALAAGPNAGVAFAYATPPGVPPSITGPVSIGSTADTTVGGVADAVSADGAAEGALAACAAVSAGTCAVGALAVAGAAYGVYSVVKFFWGGHHAAAQSPPTGNGSGPGTCYVTTGTCVMYGSPASYDVKWYPPTSSTPQPAGYQVDCSGTPAGSANSFGSTTSAASYITGTDATGFYHWMSFDCAIYDGSWHDYWPKAVTLGSAVEPGPLAQQQLQLNVNCTDGTGGTVTHAVSTSPAFDDTAVAPPDMSAVACPTGSYPGGATLNLLSTPPGGTQSTATVDTFSPLSFPNGGTSNPCAAVGAGCAPTWQVQTGTNTWVDYVPDPGGTVVPPDPSRCEWKSGTLDGGSLPASDCTATNQKPAPPAVTTGDESCVPSGAAAFNPLEWIYKPVKCALTWAFVPDTSAQTQLRADLDSFTTKPPFSLALGFGAWLTPFSSLGSDCTDWTVHVEGHDMGLLCDSSFIQKLHAERPLMLTLMMVTAFGGFLWSLWYAMIPVFRVSPSGRAMEGYGDSGGADISPISDGALSDYGMT